MPNKMEQDLERQLGYELRRDAEKAEDLYRALCKNIWRDSGHSYSWSDKEAGELIAWIRTKNGCPEESYLDYAPLKNKGAVAPWVEERLRFLGYTS